MYSPFYVCTCILYIIPADVCAQEICIEVCCSWRVSKNVFLLPKGLRRRLLRVENQSRAGKRDGKMQMVRVLNVYLYTELYVGIYYYVRSSCSSATLPKPSSIYFTHT